MTHLLSDPRVDRCSYYLTVIQRLPNRSGRLKRALEGADEYVHGGITDECPHTPSHLLSLLRAQIGDLDQVVRLAPVERVVSVALRLAMADKDNILGQILPRCPDDAAGQPFVCPLGSNEHTEHQADCEAKRGAEREAIGGGGHVRASTK
eukprot:scaffold189006_cov35-Tisochrysis_lutea.AAC.1